MGGVEANCRHRARVRRACRRRCGSAGTGRDPIGTSSPGRDGWIGVDRVNESEPLRSTGSAARPRRRPRPARGFHRWAARAPRPIAGRVRRGVRRPAPASGRSGERARTARARGTDALPTLGSHRPLLRRAPADVDAVAGAGLGGRDVSGSVAVLGRRRVHRQPRGRDAASRRRRASCRSCGVRRRSALAGRFDLHARIADALDDDALTAAFAGCDTRRHRDRR